MRGRILLLLKCQQDGTFGSQVSIRRENLGSCGISSRTKLIEKPGSSWFAKEFELAEAVAEVSGNEFVGLGMRPGDVRRLGRKSDFDEVQLPCDVLRFCEGGRDWPEPDSRGHPNGSPTSYRQPLFLLALAMGSSGDRTIFASRVALLSPLLWAS